MEKSFSMCVLRACTTSHLVCVSNDVDARSTKKLSEMTLSVNINIVGWINLNLIRTEILDVCMYVNKKKQETNIAHFSMLTRTYKLLNRRVNKYYFVSIIFKHIITNLSSLKRKVVAFCLQKL